MDLNDPIWSRARASNSPQSSTALADLPKQLRHFDEEEDAIEDGEEYVLRSENGTELDAFTYENEESSFLKECDRKAQEEK